MRCFIAIEIAPDARVELESLLKQCSLAGSDGIRWCRPEKLHVTLKFLGHVPDDRISHVCDAVRRAAAAVEPFTLELTGLDTFPPRGAPRVLWCGLRDESLACRRWLGVADPHLAGLGFEPEKRELTPHITLGRAKSIAGGRLIRSIIQSNMQPRRVEMAIERLTVFESRPNPHGSEYLAVARAALGASLDIARGVD